MTQESNERDRFIPDELRKASGLLASALVASNRELNNAWLTDVGENPEKELVKLQQNTDYWWRLTLSNISPQYIGIVSQAKGILDFANKLVLKSVDPMSLLAAVHDPFLSKWHNGPTSYNSWQTLSGILLVRGYVRLSPDMQKELLNTRGAQVRIIMDGSEDKRMKKELSAYNHGAYPSDVAEAILTGRLQLPEVPEI